MDMGRERRDLDHGWKFHYGDIVCIRNRWAWGKSGSWNQGSESKTFDDQSWKNVDLPHDFVIETQPSPYNEKEFGDDNAIPAMENVNNMHTTAGSFQRNVGWYRRHFYLEEELKGKKIYLVFEGIYRNSMVWLNDFLAGSERSGYKQQVWDITDIAEYGADNVLSVKADARESEGWFYEGGGIYRHAYLLITQEEHLEDPYVWTQVDLENKSCVVTVEATAQGFPSSKLWGLSADDQKALEQKTSEKQGVLKISIQDMDGNPSGEDTEIAITDNRVRAELKMDAVKLWDVSNPYLYTAVLTLICAGEEKDCVKIRFGVREIRFDANKGFLLNGVQTKIKGVCCHQNHGGVGTAMPDELYRYRIKKLKEMGVNAYRTSHYPPAPELLDICDEEGMLVMDENRLLSSEKGDLEQLECMVKRDRNHPSVILYSIGNEEAQSQAIPQGGRIAQTMIEHIRSLDPHTPVTMALVMWDLKNRKPIEDHTLLEGIFTKLDVAGFNYQDIRWETFHKLYPDKPFICTEQGTFKSTRGCSETNREVCHLAITDKTADSYMQGARQWHVCRPDWVSGLFIWTGFDYYGEPSPFAWPAISSQFGTMDLCGYPKDFYYYYKAWWSDEKVLHVFPEWKGIPGEKKDMHVFSNCEEIELFVNGRSIGKKKMEEDGYLVWEQVSFEPGELTAYGYQDGKKCMEEHLMQTGKAVDLQLNTAYSDGNLRILDVQVVDEMHREVTDDDQEICVCVTGGRILGTSNGNPSDHTIPGSAVRSTFHGKLQVIVEMQEDVADGTVTVKAAQGWTKTIQI